ncbi:MaoC family dehydratase [Afifella sp. IM 167]|uniref:MaoC family dehydratase n=1 Tax=Afifella sp. IM 167 TaxID=2033586 RepID=UPI001CCE72DC|nr:MaoC family dehydratase [Afifella sp. IM 167]MBZ8134876.1 enoyl-CoA hydratase [Afifella sp. IM 167]
MRYFEDFQPGEKLPLATYEVTREAIIAFAAEFDPQPFHLDEAAASRSMLGGLAASGWHTTAIFMRMMCDGWLHDTDAAGAGGVDETRWLRPVRPGDVLSGVSEVLEVKASRSRPGFGTVRFRHEVWNGAGEPVLRMLNPIAFRCRQTSAT